MADIQWFPGHMAKSGRELAESVKLADLIIEVIDSRIPGSSVNPDFKKIFMGHRRLIVLNKADLADPVRSDKWKKHFRDTGFEAMTANSRNGDGLAQIRSILRAAGEAKTGRQAERGVISRPLRAIVAGIPNSGKSSLINSLASKSAAKTGDRPGVTRRRQWIRIGEGVELLDTPGILWPKFENADVALHLAFTGAIRDEVYDIVDAAEKLLSTLCADYKDFVVARYGDITDDTGDRSAYPFLERTGKRRGFLLKGGVIDLERAAAIVLDEFRAARIGRITLETPL